MKYIGNAFSPNMVDEGTIKIEKINKNEFIEASKDSKSVIGHPEISKLFNLELNRESIYLNKGDILYVVVPSKRPMENKIVENGGKYEFIPESEGYTYKKITVL